MTRKVYNLDGVWDFIYDERNQLTIDTVHQQTWRAIHVPAPWQPQIKGLEESTGSGWYRKHFTVDNHQQEKTYILHVGAAYHYAEVWLNGHYIGDHDGGWLPFEFTLDEFLKQDGDNELIIRVVVPDSNRERYPNFPSTEILHGKQSWYGSWGGLWQSVSVEQRSTTHIQDLQLHMNTDKAFISPTITLNQWRERLTWQVDIFDSDRNKLKTEVFDDSSIVDCTANKNIFLEEAPQLWSPDAPSLYTVRVQLLQDGHILDEIKKKSGFRTIETQAGQILLNGKPFYMIGALDQGYYPDTLATPPSEDFLRDQFKKAKDMGLNTIRYHIKVADPRYYDIADEMGLLLWVDLPNWTTLTDATKERIKTTLTGMVQRDGHHPSIAIWTIVNEDWGTDLVHNAEHRQWLREMYHWMKKLDPSRLVVDNSPCEPNFHIESDIADYHYYRNIPDHAQGWDDLTKTIATDYSYIYSPNGDAHYTGQEPIIVSEFGNWGLPNIDTLMDEDGHEPWWFETGHDWGEGIVYPHGIKRRFKQWHLDEVFGSLEDLTEAMQWQQFHALKYQIEALRSHSTIQGYVITELTDVHWENNGLMDMCRNPRIFAHELARINANYLIMASFNRAAYTSGEVIEGQLKLSCLDPGGRTIKGVEWVLGDERGYIEISNIYAGCHDIGRIEIQQTVETVTVQTLRLYSHFATGEKILSNEYEVQIYPEFKPHNLSLFIENNSLKRVFEKLCYPLASSQDEADIVIITKMTESINDLIASGGSVLLVATDTDALPQYESGYVIYQDVPFARIIERQSTIWNGDWVSTFSWLKSSFQQVASPIMNKQFADITPDYVLTGYTQADMVEGVGAGMFVGWIHRPVTLLGFRKYHQGHIAVTTFNLQSLDVDNPAQSYLVEETLKSLAKNKAFTTEST